MTFKFFSSFSRNCRPKSKNFLADLLNDDILNSCPRYELTVEMINFVYLKYDNLPLYNSTNCYLFELVCLHFLLMDSIVGSVLNWHD